MIIMVNSTFSVDKTDKCLKKSKFNNTKPFQAIKKPFCYLAAIFNFTFTSIAVYSV